MCCMFSESTLYAKSWMNIADAENVCRVLFCSLHPRDIVWVCLGPSDLNLFWRICSTSCIPDLVAICSAPCRPNLIKEGLFGKLAPSKPIIGGLFCTLFIVPS